MKRILYVNHSSYHIAEDKFNPSLLLPPLFGAQNVQHDYVIEKIHSDINRDEEEAQKKKSLSLRPRCEKYERQQLQRKQGRTCETFMNSFVPLIWYFSMENASFLIHITPFSIIFLISVSQSPSSTCLIVFRWLDKVCSFIILYFSKGWLYCKGSIE